MIDVYDSEIPVIQLKAKSFAVFEFAGVSIEGGNTRKITGYESGVRYARVGSEGTGKMGSGANAIAVVKTSDTGTEAQPGTVVLKWTSHNGLSINSLYARKRDRARL